MRLPSPELTKRLSADQSFRRGTLWSKTPEQRQITQLLEVGVSRKFIAQHLGLTQVTVDKVWRRWKWEERIKIFAKRAQVSHGTI
jgi:DNA-binding NarL/FixJ family response regulator